MMNSSYRVDSAQADGYCQPYNQIGLRPGVKPLYLRALVLPARRLVLAGLSFCLVNDFENIKIYT